MSAWARVPSSNSSRRSQREVRAVEAEVLAEIRVARFQHRRPFQMEQVVFAFEAGLLLAGILVAARLRFQMVQLGVRRPYYAVTGLQHRQAEIDIVEGQDESLVETADLFKHRSR